MVSTLTSKLYRLPLGRQELESRGSAFAGAAAFFYTVAVCRVISEKILAGKGSSDLGITGEDIR